jgi:hypothetical protein
MNALGHSIGVAVALVTMVAIASHEASAKGGTFQYRWSV